MKDRRAFVLLSGGLDSTTVLYLALSQPQWNVGVEAVSIDYGQRHRKEMEYAAETAKRLKIKHSVIRMPDLLAGSMLTDASIEIPNVDYADIKGVSPTYVPFRNGLMLSLLTAHAQKWVDNGDGGGLDNNPAEAGIYFGAHAEDASNWAYPDCTPEFIGAMANAIYVGSYFATRLYTPIMWMQKHEVVTLGCRLGVDFSNTWSCYAGGEQHCGRCPTCRARRLAFVQAGVADPTVYEKNPNA